MFQRVLIANRGEIACRVMRSCRALGLETLAVYSEADAGALHVQIADAAHEIGPPPARQSYLAADRILAAARALGAEAVHPGYGFLAESSAFARAVLDAGLAWIGPRPETIADMGDKERARLLAKAAGVPILPGSGRFQTGDLGGLDEAAAAVGFPLLVKASAGGGGIGMRRVDGPEGLGEVVEATQTAAERAFADGTVYLERYLPRPRHVEIQVFGLGEGHVVHMFERECSIQRRFQKIVEESPSPGISPRTREAMAEAALALALQERYRGAGTVEFVVDADERFYFLEMNTRIQVEHPVTEMTTGLDLVELQIRVARGDDLSALVQDGVRAQGHAIECRIYAEDPAKNFLPSPGAVTAFDPPAEGGGVRIDTGIREGDQITFHYDPMIAKAVVHGATREQARDKMLAALADFRVEGIATNIAFLRRTLAHPAFAAGETHTDFIEAHGADLLAG